LVKRFLHLLQSLRDSDGGVELPPSIRQVVQSLAASNQSWQDYIITQILKDDNPFTRQVQQIDLAKLPPALVACRTARFTSFTKSLQLQ
jgi:hypothetical protein